MESTSRNQNYQLVTLRRNVRGTRFFSHFESAYDAYRRVVQGAESGWDMQSIELVKVRGLMRERLYEWKAPDAESETAPPETAKNAVELRFGYKIHGLKTAKGLVQSSNTSKFYGTYDEAHSAAVRYVSRTNNSDDAGIVIYKAIEVVRRKDVPVEIETVNVQ